MDPLSVAASVAGLITVTAQAASGIASFVSTVKDAPKTVRQMVTELEAMSSVLGDLEAFLKDSDASNISFDPSSVLVIATKTCSDQLDSLNSRLHTFDSGKLSRVLERVKWPFNEKETLRELKVLRRHTAMFQFSLTTEGCKMLSQTSKIAVNSLEIQLQISAKVIELTQNIETMSVLLSEASKLSTQLGMILKIVNDVQVDQATVQGLADGVKSLMTDAQETKAMALLDWLSSTRQSQEHREISSKRLPGTGQWLLECSVLNAWLNGLEPVLCCTGNPGVGKSMLASLVVDKLRNSDLSRGTVTAYFYFDYHQQESQSPATFVASVLRQLVTRLGSIPRSLLNLYERYKLEDADFLSSELSDVLEDTLTHFGLCFLVVDAFDECIDSSCRKGILKVLQHLAKANVRLLIISRPHTYEISQHFSSALRLEIEASQRDLMSYCYHMIDESENVRDIVDEDFRKEIVETVATKAQGMFLLVVLQMQDVLDGMTRSQIRKSLHNMTSNLNEAFGNTMQRILSQSRNRREIATKALMWISHACRPLSVKELCLALAVGVGDSIVDEEAVLQPRTIVDTCAGLVIINEEDSTARLVHYTLQEYLHSSQRGMSTFEEAETYITQVLLTYLCIDPPASADHTVCEGQNSRSFHHDDRLLDYAATQWGHHAKLASESKIRTPALDFLTSSIHVELAARQQLRSLGSQRKTYHHRGRTKEPRSVNQNGLHLAAGFGLSALISDLIDRGDPIDAQDFSGNAPLHVAAVNGELEAVKVLVEKSARIEILNLNNYSPLYLAVALSHKQIVEYLLDNGTAVEDSSMDGWTPLHKAANNGDAAIVRTLLEHGATPLKASPRGLIPLHGAAGRGHLITMEVLIASGSPVDYETKDRWTPLHGASVSGQTDAALVLIKHGALVNKTNEDDRTPLHLACRGGHILTVSALLKNGANTMNVDTGRDLPLHRAAKGGHEEVADLLLTWDTSTSFAQLTAHNAYGRSPQVEASYSGHWQFVSHLRARQWAFMSDRELPGRLEAAIHAQDSSLVKELLADGSDVNLLNSDGLAPMHIALLLGFLNIAELLLDSEHINMTAPTADGWTPIHCAAKAGSERLVTACLERGADVALRTKDGQTPLHKACKSGSAEMVRLLLERGAEIEAQDDWGWRPIHTAAAHGFQPVVETLIAYGADLSAKEKTFRHARACAARAGHHALVEYLKEQAGDRDVHPAEGHAGRSEEDQSLRGPDGYGNGMEQGAGCSHCHLES